MTRIQWNPPANPPYEAGVDRGIMEIIFTPTSGGIVQPWNGLISVEESFIGGERSTNHFDGVKISESVATRNWQGVIRAYNYPTDFDDALGYYEIRLGFYLTRQPRYQFNFGWRVMKGDGSYKLHVVYNATVVPNHPARKTMSDTPDPDIYEWTVSAVPWTGTTTTVPGFKPSAHVVVDSSELTAAQLVAVENRMYGNPASAYPATSIPNPQTLFELASV